MLDCSHSEHQNPDHCFPNKSLLVPPQQPVSNYPQLQTQSPGSPQLVWKGAWGGASCTEHSAHISPPPTGPAHSSHSNPGAWLLCNNALRTTRRLLVLLWVTMACRAQSSLLARNAVLQISGFLPNQTTQICLPTLTLSQARCNISRF